VLCRYGIVYVTDPQTGKFLPTCCRMRDKSILADADYLNVLNYAPDDTTSLYETEARRINDIHRKIREVARIELPYDVFICYKKTTAAS